MLVGHTKIRELLGRLVAKGRLHHALLFLGPQAIGKYLVAVELAEKLLGAKAPHPDLHILNCNETKDIDSLRLLLSKLQLKPFLGGKRVVILRDLDELGIGSLNLLLKTLEEPLPATYFIMTATQALRLPRTILSRAQNFQFNLLSDVEIAEILKARGQEMSPLLQGSLSLIDQNESEVLPAVEGILRGHYLELTKLILELDKGDVHRVIGILINVLRREMLLEGPHQRKLALTLENLLFAEILISQRNINPSIALSCALVADGSLQDSFRLGAL
jgi:DNA polymerase III gamma/tau subunit